MWEKISSTKELICYEKKKKDLFVRLEARHSGGQWIIYRGFYNKENLNYTEEYSVASREEAENMIVQLKSEKDLTKEQISKLMKRKNRRLQINVKRAYRDDAIEKWFFGVNSDPSDNFFLVREFDKIEMDIVLHEKYKGKSDEIFEEICGMLSFDEIVADIDHTFYYFSETSKMRSRSNLMKYAQGEFEFEFFSDND